MKTIWSHHLGNATWWSAAVFSALLLIAPVRAGDATPAIAAVAALSDPAKLATLKGDRAANDRLHKVLAWLEEARRAGMIPSKTIDEAQKITHDAPAHAAIVKEMLLRNFELCERSAVFTDDNLARMKRGYSPLVTSGTFIGQPYEVDHIIPVHEFPALENELANLIYLPRTQNRRKSDDIKQRAIDLGTKFVAGGLLTKEYYDRLHQIRQWGDAAAPAPAAEAAADPRIVNLNKASAKALEALPGIGPKTAASIIAARPLKNLSDLDKVPGIGPKTIEALRGAVRF